MKKITQTFLAVAVALGFAQSTLADITVKGSDTMVILAQKWAETYMGQKSGVKIQVTGGGTGTGFAALQNKSTDLANASRQIKPPASPTTRLSFIWENWLSTARP